MRPIHLMLLLLIPLTAGGCSHGVAPGQANLAAMSYEDIPVEDGSAYALDDESPAPVTRSGRGRGVDPYGALRSAQAASARWKREKPVTYTMMPVHPGEAALKSHVLPKAFTEVRGTSVVRAGEPQATAFATLKGNRYDGEATMRRLEESSRRGVGSICTGC